MDCKLQTMTMEETKLLRKIDLFLLPTVWLIYLFSYMDRTNIGNAKVVGMDVDLGLTSDQYSLVLIVFFITYVVFEVPSNLILIKTRPSIFLPSLMILWGIVTCCMALVKSYHQLIALRLLVGALESCFAPGVLLLFSSWYKKNEQSKRFAVYISAAVLSGAFGGILAGAITGGLDGAYGMAGWRWLFIVEGVATVSWAIVAHFLLLDFPSNTNKFSAAERALAQSRLQADNIETRVEDVPRVTSWQALCASVKDWRTWLFVLGYMIIVGSSTMTYFYPALVKDLGYTSHMAQYMVVPIYAVSFVAVAATGYFMDKIPRHRGLVIAGWLGISFICSVCICTIYNPTARLSLSYAASTFGAMPQEVRGVSLAIVNAMGNTAQIHGAYLFPSEDGPKYLKGFGAVSGMCGFGIVIYAASHFLLKRFPANSNAALLEEVGE
ncbi:hypothetical protein BLS_009860 [Venturia inaequalis]|uniref:Major facilitator superfamily (MFS) profile domain-containing protein n=1 Tax=Venturia inaequalis TaxID=5025 RepID=A0A8H3U484_VENIN|nr:hypothetical protein BLS_009860 [Venturia inaequalis]